MPNVKLTKGVCDRAIHTGRGNQTLYRDEGKDAVPGLALRVTAGGAKAFVVEYRDRGNRKRRLTLQRYGRWTVDQARIQAKKKLYGLADGVDPMETRKREREGDTLADVGERYLADLKARAEAGARRGRLAGWDSAAGLWRRHVPAGLKRRKAVDVSAEDVRQPLKKLAEAGKAPTADHVRTVLHAVLEQARVEGLRSDNPVAAVKRYAKPGKRRRALDLAELAALGAVLRTVETTGKLTLTEDGEEVTHKVAREAATALRLLALTGARRSELLGHPVEARRGPREGLRWADVDLDAGTYRLEAHGGGSGGKGGAPRTLPLGKAAVELLEAIRPEAADDDPELPVVPSPKKRARPAAKEKDRAQPFVGLDRCRRRIFAAAGIEGADAHSLRHSFESIAFETAPAFAGALTGRAAVRDPVLASYIHPDADRLREVADKVSQRLADALDGKLAAVLPFKKAAESE